MLCGDRPSEYCVRRHAADSRRHVPHGIGQALSRRSAGPSRHRGRLLDRPHAGDEPAIQGIRQGDRPRHRSPRFRPIRRTIPARCRTCSMPARWCSRRRRVRSISATGASGGLSSRVPTGAIPIGPKSNINTLDNHPVVHVAYSRRARLRAHGPARICRPRRNGNSPRAAGSTAPSLPGATSSRPAASTWPIPGRVNFHAQNLSADGFERTSPVTRIPAERLRPARHDRQCLGMDDRLVFAKASRRMRRRRAAFRRIRAAAARPTATTPPAERQNSTQGASKAARICARRTTADATGRQRAMRSRSTLRQVTLAFDASGEEPSDASKRRATPCLTAVSGCQAAVSWQRRHARRP